METPSQERTRISDVVGAFLLLAVSAGVGLLWVLGILALFKIVWYVLFTL